MMNIIFSKLLDGLIFFLLFQLYGYLWETYIINQDPDPYEDQPAPDYEALNTYQTEPAIIPFLGDPDNVEAWLV